jgi:lipoprotein-anchoring transpeptidase ErfK/SrfK
MLSLGTGSPEARVGTPPRAPSAPARSPELPRAGGFVRIHGTNQPELLPGRVSHGCIRMRNEDILELGRLMPIGTPVTVR